MSFRGRLILFAGYLLTAVVLALEVPLALNVERRAASEFQSGVLGNAAILASRISDLVTASTTAQPAAAARLAAVVGETRRLTNERIVVTDGRGRVLADSDRAAAVGELYATSERPEFGEALFAGRIDFRRRFSDTLGEELLLVTVPIVDQERVVGAVRISVPTGSVQGRVRESWLGLALIGVAVIAAGLAVAWVMATSLARPVRRLEAAAERLGRGDLATRAPTGGPKEIAALARSFNFMADALSANLQAQRDFLANASHQLRTPLTGMKLRLEAIREEGGPTAEEAAKAERELDRLNELVDDLLTLARASSIEATGASVDLADVARGAVERWREPAEALGQDLELGRDGQVRVWANSGDLAHVLDNLIENALRYCPPGTRVTVEAGTSDGRAALIVSDTGPGIPPQDQPRVFERFYRGSRGREAGPGTGLGLAIVAELARHWGGEVRLLDGPGTRIEVSFPRLPSNR